MKNTASRKIAQRYVKALFSSASEQHAVAAVEKDMASLMAAMAESPELRMLMESPLMSAAGQKSALELLLRKMGAHALTAQFVALLADKKRLGILSAAAGLFADMASQSRGEIKAEMITAGKASKEEIAQTSARLGEMYGKKVILSVKQDPSLLGGVIIRIGSTQLDGSLAGKLERLGQKLKAA